MLLIIYIIDNSIYDNWPSHLIDLEKNIEERKKFVYRHRTLTGRGIKQINYLNKPNIN